MTRALKIFEKHHGKDHPDIGMTLKHLAFVWGATKEFEKQKDALSQAHKIYERHYGSDHLEAGIILAELGDAWASLENYKKQIETLKLHCLSLKNAMEAIILKLVKYS